MWCAVQTIYSDLNSIDNSHLRQATTFLLSMSISILFRCETIASETLGYGVWLFTRFSSQSAGHKILLNLNRHFFIELFATFPFNFQ